MEKSVLAKELIKVAKLIRFATDFSTQEALDAYLEKHPKADKEKHKVKDKMPKRKFTLVDDDEETRKKVKNLKKNVKRIKEEPKKKFKLVDDDKETKEKVKNLKKNVKRIKEES
jgi:uncharacterized protein Yka (UPF0111/DUF47 family)